MEMECIHNDVQKKNKLGLATMVGERQRARDLKTHLFGGCKSGHYLSN